MPIIIWLFCFIVQCVKFSTSQAFVTPTNGVVSLQLQQVKSDTFQYTKKVINELSPVSINCTVNVSLPKPVTVNWYNITYNQVPKLLGASDFGVDIVSNLDSSQKMASLTFLKPDDWMLGKYKCEFVSSSGTPVSTSVSLESAPLIMKFGVSIRLSEQNPMTIVCNVVSAPVPHAPVTWYQGNCSYNTTPPCTATTWRSGVSFRTSNGPNYCINDTLVIDSLQMGDAGVYWCTVSQGANMDYAAIVVHVKDRLAALWPFIGILIEVILLIICIGFYEKHKANAKRAAAAYKTSSSLPIGTNNINNNTDGNTNLGTTVVHSLGNQNNHGDVNGGEIRQRSAEM